MREILTVGDPPLLRQPAREREEVPAVPQGDGEEVPVAGGGQDIPHLPPAPRAALLVKKDVNEFPHFFSRKMSIFDSDTKGQRWRNDVILACKFSYPNGTNFKKKAKYPFPNLKLFFSRSAEAPPHSTTGRGFWYAWHGSRAGNG